MIETWIRLKPKDEWRAGLTTEMLIKEFDSLTKMPGLVNSFGYPCSVSEGPMRRRSAPVWPSTRCSRSAIGNRPVGGDAPAMLVDAGVDLLRRPGLLRSGLRCRGQRNAYHHPVTAFVFKPLPLSRPMPQSLTP